jgi:adenylosuccinate lyase
LRRENFHNPYEALKALTRGAEQINQDTMVAFIDSLDVKETVKKELKKITPWSYTGI